MKKSKTPRHKKPGRRKQAAPRELQVAGKAKHGTTRQRPGTY